jgi:hypothetical protein
MLLATFQKKEQKHKTPEGLVWPRKSPKSRKTNYYGYGFLGLNRLKRIGKVGKTPIGG